MKKLFLIIAFTTAAIGQAQTFTFNADGTADYVVFEVPNLKAAEIYTKTMNWINATYKNPELVVKAKIENEMIRLEGFHDAAFSRTTISGSKPTYGVHYTLLIEMQDGKYRVKYSHDKFSDKVFFPFTDVITNVVDRNGNGWAGSKEEYEGTVQKLMLDLNSYIIKPKEKW